MVERVEVVVGEVDLRPLDDAVAEPDEHVLDLAPGGGEDVQVARRAATGVPGSVTSTTSAASLRLELERLELGRARVDRGLQRLARLVGALADRTALLGRELADVAQQVRQLGFTAEEAHAHLFELGG